MHDVSAHIVCGGAEGRVWHARRHLLLGMHAGIYCYLLFIKVDRLSSECFESVRAGGRKCVLMLV